MSHYHGSDPQAFADALGEQWHRCEVSPLALLNRCLAAAVIVASGCAAADLRPNLPAVPAYEVHRSPSRMVIDGRLDEEAWKIAPPMVYQFPWDKQTGARQNTTARLLWDDEFLYVGWECDDSDIVAHYRVHDDPTYKDDAVEIFINPDPRQNFYYGMEINARATVYDYFYAFPRLLIKRVDFEGLQIASYIRGSLNVRGDQDKGWTIELAIPWRNFVELAPKSPPDVGATWTANLNRWDGVEPDRRLSQWSDSGLVEASPHNPDRFGRLVFVK